MNELEKSFQFFKENIEDLKSKYINKFIVIINCKVIASYDDYAVALETTLTNYELGTFLIQKVENTPNSFTLYLNRFAVV